MKKSHATALRCAITLMMLCGTPIQAQAFSINATKSNYESGGVRYNFVVSNWTSNDNSPSPCSSDDISLTSCSIRLTANRGDRIVESSGTKYLWEVPVRQRSSMGELLSDLQNKGFRVPFDGSLLIPHASSGNDLCISFFVARTGSHGAVYGPFGPCTPVSTPPLQCELEGNTTIEHGNLPDNKLNGAKALTLLELRCKGPSNVTVSASRTNYLGVQLRSDGSLYSKITVNGKDATDGITFPVEYDWPRLLNITSTLSTQGTVAPGTFSGSTIITLSPP